MPGVCAEIGARAGLSGGQIIMFQPLAHTYHIINCIAQPTIELNNSMVGRPDLQIDFRTPGLPKPSFRFGDDGTRISTPLQVRDNCQIIEPASMALVTGHHAGDNLTVKNTHQKQFRVDEKFALNVSMRIIPGPNQVTSSPKGHDCFLVL
jgi:hypothetical protein